jgi:hypothetical protein
MNMTTASDLKHKLICLREALASRDMAERLSYMHNKVDMVDEAIAALSQPNEPVGEVLLSDTLKDGAIVGYANIDYRKVKTGDKLFTATPNTSELEQANKVLADKCKELEEWLETHHDALVKRDAKIAELTAKLEKMRELLDRALDDSVEVLNSQFELLPYKQTRYDNQERFVEEIKQALEECEQ